MQTSSACGRGRKGSASRVRDAIVNVISERKSLDSCERFAIPPVVFGSRRRAIDAPPFSRTGTSSQRQESKQRRVTMGTTRGAAAFRCLLVILCVIALIPGDTLAYMPPPQQAASSTSTSQTQSAKIPPDQLDSLVAPIALYPDPLLAQIMAASTYPLEIIQLQQWLTNHKNLKDKALADAVAKESWDPSIQAMAALPDVVNRLANDIKWTTDLGNAFLAQQSDVMDSVQRMRKKAQDKGTFKSTEQQTVETRIIENKSVIVVEQSNPEILYVPSYDPVVVYGPPVYPYPYYPYYPAGYYAAGLAISFGIGLAMGAWWGGGWGCGWGNNNININNNNNFVRNSNRGGNRASQLPARGGGDRGNFGGDRGNLGGGNRASTLPA